MKAHILRSALLLVAILSLTPTRGRAGAPDVPAPPRLMVQVGHAGGVSAAGFSPDGRLIITASADKTARVWDVATGRELVILPHENILLSAALSPDGKRAVTSTRDDPVVRVWDTTTGKQLHALKGHDLMAWRAEFTPDGKKVVTTATDKKVRVWDAGSGKKLFTIDTKWSDTSVPPALLSPDGKRIATAEAGGSVTVWDAGDGKKQFGVPGDGDAYWWWASFSRDGGRLATRSGNTVKVWDAADGKALATLKGHDAQPTSAAFSPDGKKMLTAALDGTVRVWDAASGKEHVKFTDHYPLGKPVPSAGGFGVPAGPPPKLVNSAAFSPDGKRVISVAALTGSPLVWDAATGKDARPLRTHIGTESAGFSPDGRKVLTNSVMNGVWIWDAATGKDLYSLGGHAARVWSAAFTPAGLQVLSASWTPGVAAGTLRAWNATTGNSPVTLEGAPWYTGDGQTAFTSDGRRVTAPLAGTEARVWDTATGKPVVTLKGHTQVVGLVEISPDGRKVLTWASDKSTRVWEVATGKELARLVAKKGPEVTASASFSPDAERIVTTGGSFALQAAPDKNARIWDAATGKQLKVLKGHADAVRRAAFSPDGKKVVTASADGTAIIWNAATGNKLHDLKGHAAGVASAEFSADGKKVVTAAWDGTARIWDAEAGTESVLLRGDDKFLTGASFSRDGKWVVTTSADHSVRLWDAATGKERCRLVFFRDGTWAAVDPEGRFDASNGGDVEGMHWVVGLEPVALKQLKNRYYEPGLVQKILGLNKEPLRPVGGFAGVDLYPNVEVTPPPPGQSGTTIRLTNRGGGIGRVAVLVNGKELLADARGPKPDPDAKETTLAVDLSKSPNLIPGKPNRVEVVAYNAQGYLSSRGATFDFEAAEAAQTDPPHLHAIVCGVATYASPRINLKYSAKDAEDFAAALTLAGGRLFGADRVHVTTLVTSDKPGAPQPTKENIRKAFEAVRKAKPGDVLVVYLAGHGTTLARGSDLYLYPTRDATSLAPEAFADPSVLAATAVTSEELTDWLKAVPANKQVMILDTCAAGAAAAKLTEKRDVSGDQVRALDRLKDRTGFHVLMGCASDAVSYEATRFAQGLLTYSLLEGMKGAALRDGEFVEVDRLFAYATDRVPALAGDVGGVQRPLVAAPRGASGFPVGRLTAEDKSKVPLAAARPLVLQSNFQNDDLFEDDLGLKKLVDERLRDLAGVTRGSKVVFVEATEFPGALRVVGRYKADGGKVNVEVRVFGGKEKIPPFTLSGEAGKPAELATRLVAEVEKRLPAK